MDFSILDHLDKLEPAKEKGKYICPACGDDNFSFGKNGFSCFGNGCDSKDIINALAPLPQRNGKPHYSPRPKKKPSARERERAVQLDSARIEAKVDELLLMVGEGIHTLEQAQIELGNWAKAEGYSAFDAGQLFKAKAKELGLVGAGTPKPDLLTLEEVRQQLERLVIEGVGAADIELELVNLGRASGIAPRTLQGIYRALLQESERNESTQDALAAFDDLLKASSQTCDVGALLPSLAGPLGHYAKAFNQESVTFSLPLLTVAASLLSPETDLVIGGVTDYRLPPVLWGGLVAEPGSIKTPIYNAILKPLVYRQVSAKDEFDRQFDEYETALKAFRALGKEEAQRADEPKEPKLRQYYVDSATTEAVQRIVTSQTDKGLAVAVDELSGFFHGFNQYKSGGKGSDRDFWKSAADGGAVKIDRVSGTQFAAKTSVSVTGTVQPEVLGGLMAAGDPDGFWSRFLWVRLPLNRLPARGDGPKGDRTDLLLASCR
jgi:hypothetical protein